MELEKILKRIAAGKNVKSSEIIPHLRLEKKEERLQVNRRLAEACLKAGNLEHARVFVQRAWILSKFSERILSLYIDIHASLDDIDSIRKAYKRAGMVKAQKEDIAGAIRYFVQSMYAYAMHRNLDKYEFDFDILEQIEALAKPYQFRPKFETNPLTGRKIRVAYLIYGMTHEGSVMVKINRLFAMHHDKSRFEVVFFVPESKSVLFSSNYAKENIRFFGKHGCSVVAPDSKDDKESLFEAATQIYKYRPDILITDALLADLRHYFIVSLRPAPVIMGFSQGPPPQFASPLLDWSISWTIHSLIDCPCDCSLVDLEVDLPKVDKVGFYSRERFNVPEEAVVLMSGGRPPKFQNTEFWKAILEIMHLNPSVYFMALGIDKVPSFLEKMITQDVERRIRFQGWRGDYLKTLGLADIILDTYPSGGGVVLMDAMAFGIPVVSFKNNYMKIFDQTDWSPAEEFITIPDLLIERGNFEQFKRVLLKLINDQEYRKKMAKECMNEVHTQKGNPERMVRRCEEVYLKVLEKKLQHYDIAVFEEGVAPVISDIGAVEYVTRSLKGSPIRFVYSCYQRLPSKLRQIISKYRVKMRQLLC